MSRDDHPARVTAVLDVSGVQWASEKAVAETVLSRRPGVLAVDANPVAQTATVTYDPDRTSVAQLAGWVRDCGYHCAGQSVPEHICDPLVEPHRHDGHPPPAPLEAAPEHVGHRAPEAPKLSPHEAMGHGGHARDVDGRHGPRHAQPVPGRGDPVGADPAVVADRAGGARLRRRPRRSGCATTCSALLLSLPVIFYSAWIFFDGAWRALRARTLDMMVLVAVAVGAGWLYSLGVTLTGGGEVFYEAATVLTAFVLLGHWFEMRARGGANDAIRTPARARPADGGGAPRRATRSRCRPPRCRSATCCWSVPARRSRSTASSRTASPRSTSPMVTGESLPVPKAAGAEVIGASVNTTGTLRVRATKVGADTALAQIVALVQEAQNSKAPGQRLADRAAFWLVLVALVGGAGDVPGLARRRTVGAGGVAVRHHRGGHHLPRRAGPGHPDRDHGRHRPRRQARACCSRTPPRWRPRPGSTPS